jgi:hypothetical protein
MLILDPVIPTLAVALGIGLLIGGERERRKGEGLSRAPAGIRTFTVTSLAGAISFMLGGELLLALTTAGVITLTALAYWRAHEDDPGLTTEIALILTALLGGLSVRQTALAAGVAVAVAILLAARTPLHHFVRSVLTESEVNDALMFAGATLVVLPLLPDRALGPYGAINPHSIWIIVILVMVISGAGYIAVPCSVLGLGSRSQVSHRASSPASPRSAPWVRGLQRRRIFSRLQSPVRSCRRLPRLSRWPLLLLPPACLPFERSRGL